MNTFTFQQPADISAALAASDGLARFIAGGTTLIDLMKLNVEAPAQLIDINKLPLNQIEETGDGGLKIGALVRNSTLAHHPSVLQRYPVLSQALLSGASAQLRNAATTGGNLLQRTRCIYFRDTTTPCNKRQPGSGCPAIKGHNRMLAILGASDACIATNPSDMNVALSALEATVHLKSARGERSVPITKFFLLPGTTPELETVLEPGELITHISLPPLPAGVKSTYLKLRDRASYEFALASAAVVAHVRNGKFEQVRVALGGVGTKPWRSLEAEKALAGKLADAAHFRAAAEAALKGARPQTENGFKVELAKRCLTHALAIATNKDA